MSLMSRGERRRKALRELPRRRRKEKLQACVCLWTHTAKDIDRIWDPGVHELLPVLPALVEGLGVSGLPKGRTGID